MEWYYIVLIALSSIIGLCFLTSLICFLMTFYARKRKPLKEGEFRLIKGKIYEEYYPAMIEWMKQNRALPKTEMCIRSYDGLKLYGTYFECEKGAPVEILFNGYRGEPERDMSGAVERCFALRHNVILACQRACGKSDGKVITFGIRESKDCISWIEHAIKVFGDDVELIIGGVSMGGSTVLMAGANKLPKNVKYILSDCAFSSAKSVIKKVVKQMHLPASVFYPFIKLGARLFGGFNLEEKPPIEAVENISIPVIFFHGDIDDFVPFYMAQELYRKCKAPKKFLAIKDAGHGLAFPKAKEEYLNAIREFEKENNIW